MSVATVSPEQYLPAAGMEDRAMTALLACIARFGLGKTTLDDVAREAGCSRATLYRYFDGKAELVRRTVEAEQGRITGLMVDLARAAPTFADAVVAVVTTAARELVGSEALQFLLAYEPEAILGHLAFGPGDQVLVAVGDACAPGFDAWLTPIDAARAGDWLARILRSYVLMPDLPIDLTDPVPARRFLESFVIPGLEPRSGS
ncbi:MAG: TetR/AcrR family transcriptional regulator [Acidimicrobiia bacterium]